MTDRNAEGHNALQRHYYESALDKPAMQIRDTPYVHRHVERMVRHAGLAAGQQILEVGAGLGKFSLPLLRAGYGLSCNDLSPVMLDRLAAAAQGPVETIACDVKAIAAHTPKRFDRVIGFFTLHHMMDLPAVFSGMAQVLETGGELAFIEPMGRNPLYLAQIALTPGMSLRAERGVFDMSDRVVHAAMRQAGLEPLSSIGYGFMPPFVVNRPAGERVEDWLGGQHWMRWAHAFLLFRARKAT